MNLGTTIKDLRSLKKLTQYDLAKKANISKNALWNYENNKREPSIETLNKLASALEVTINDLLWPDHKDKEIRFENLRNNFNDNDINLLIDSLEKLNNIGFKKVVNYTKDLAEMPKYSSNFEETPYLIACHDDTLTDEEKAIMNKKIAEALKNLK